MCAGWPPPASGYPWAHGLGMTPLASPVFIIPIPAHVGFLSSAGIREGS